MTLALRPARPDDAELLFQWVNRPDSLAGKLRTTAPIPRATHEAWFRACLADAACRIWIAELDGEAVGQVRLADGAKGWEVDIYLVPERRGHGLAHRMLDDAVARLRREHPRARVVARIRHDNAASHRLFERAGFRGVAAADDHVVLASEPTATEVN